MSMVNTNVCVSIDIFEFVFVYIEYDVYWVFILMCRSQEELKQRRRLKHELFLVQKVRSCVFIYSMTNHQFYMYTSYMYVTVHVHVICDYTCACYMWLYLYIHVGKVMAHRAFLPGGVWSGLWEVKLRKHNIWSTMYMYIIKVSYSHHHPPPLNVRQNLLQYATKSQLQAF